MVLTVLACLAVLAMFVAMSSRSLSAQVIGGTAAIMCLALLPEQTATHDAPRVDYPTCVANVVAASIAPEVCESLLTPAERERLVRDNHNRG